MRLNKFIATHSGLSRREVDILISNGNVKVNGTVAILGQQVNDSDQITIKNHALSRSALIYLALNKPVGYVCSRRAQGAKTIYELLPTEYKALKTVGRLDKDSSGLILLTNDGGLGHRLTHPSFAKTKIYQVELNKPFLEKHKRQLEAGIELSDGPSRLEINAQDSPAKIEITMTEGRNRQVRRTFAVLGYLVISLHRTTFGPFNIGDLKTGDYKKVKP